MSKANEVSEVNVVNRGEIEIIRRKAARFSTTNISDALDSLSLKSGICGILPLFVCPKIFGPAVTLRITAFGLTPSKSHLGIEAITASQKGDIIVIDNGGRKDVSCWGEILSYGAKIKGVEGVVIDGAFRDIDDIRKTGFSVYARAVVPVTARKRIMGLETNTIIQCGGVQVRPGDFVMADGSGVVIIPMEKIEEVLNKAETLFNKEQAMIKELQKGIPIAEVDQKYAYEKMID